MVMRISSEQLKRLEEACLTDFFKRAMTHLRGFDRIGFGVLEEKAQFERMRRIYDAAREFGAVTEKEVVLFGELCCVLGTERIDEATHPWYHQQLIETDSDRMRTLEYLRDVAREKQSRPGGSYA